MAPRARSAAICLAAGVCFVIGGLWYSPLLFGSVYVALRGIDSSAASSAAPPYGELIAEVLRCLVVAATFAYFTVRLGIDTGGGALKLALLVWIGFQGFVLIGSVVHEGYPVGLFAIHAGDALAKAIASCVILALWHKRAVRAEGGA